MGGLLGGGGKAPPWLLTLTPQAPAPASIARTAGAGEAVTIEVPVVPKEIRTNRVPVQSGPTAIAYIKDLTWVDTPDRLFQDLLTETVTRTTNRVVLDPRQSSLDPGVTISGNLSRFGYDAQEGMVVVRYDAAMSRAGGTRSRPAASRRASRPTAPPRRSRRRSTPPPTASRSSRADGSVRL